ncbi:hypothetical protein [uncultured Methanobrevibacter sp.]|uniref:hypothetical protein n=1 Tax=uncultured Methanobrevibacter sp. TaxID=253161 RepID=UPI0025E85044|nr:hypothetical protein [uncultured Methanobrevibacter sp.]
MYLIPFGQSQKSYTIEPEDIKLPKANSKKWLQKGLNRERYYEKLKEEIENEKMD